MIREVVGTFANVENGFGHASGRVNVDTIG
jgi:hypothetical protein